MIEPPGSTGGPRGCLAAGAGFAALIVISPIAAVVNWWRRSRRGPEPKKHLDFSVIDSAPERELRRIDLTLDLPAPVDPEFHRRHTDAVVRVAEYLHHPDDIYHLVFRHPHEAEPELAAIGPSLQEFGARFHLVHTRTGLSGRTLVWLTLGRGTALAEVVDPVSCDPESDGETEDLLKTPQARWTMATSWARVGPSHVVRMIAVVPAESAEIVAGLLDSIV